MGTLWINSRCPETVVPRIVPVNHHNAWLVGGKQHTTKNRQMCRTAPAAFSGLWPPSIHSSSQLASQPAIHPSWNYPHRTHVNMGAEKSPWQLITLSPIVKFLWLKKFIFISISKCNDRSHCVVSWYQQSTIKPLFKLHVTQLTVNYSKLFFTFASEKIQKKKFWFKWIR